MTPVYQDGIVRTKSPDPTAHRDFVVLNPPLEGRDVANAQRAVRDRLDMRGLDVPTPVHGKWTHASAVAAVEAGYFLGLLPSTYLRQEKVGTEQRLVLTQGAQTIIRNPGSRSKDQLSRAKDRQEQLAKGPKFFDQIATDLGVKVGNREEALAWAIAQVGVHENPPMSNWGHPVQDWAKLAGYLGPVPWCGCFDNVVLFHGGITDGPGWIGYTPAIITHAKSGKNGWRWVGPTDGQRGMLALFDTPGGDPAVHTGVVLKRINASTYMTVEGNTGGSNPADGGMVAVNTRSTGGNFHIVGFAVPPWKS